MRLWRADEAKRFKDQSYKYTTYNGILAKALTLVRVIYKLWPSAYTEYETKHCCRVFFIVVPCRPLGREVAWLLRPELLIRVRRNCVAYTSYRRVVNKNRSWKRKNNYDRELLPESFDCIELQKAVSANTNKLEKEIIYFQSVGSENSTQFNGDERW